VKKTTTELPLKPELEAELRKKERPARIAFLAIVGFVIGVIVWLACAVARASGVLHDPHFARGPVVEEAIGTVLFVVMILAMGALSVWTIADVMRR